MKQEACPSCREEGHDRKGNNLTRFPEGNAYCHRCGYKEGKGEGEKVSAKQEYSRLTPTQVSSYPLGGDPKRLVDDSILKDYQVRVSCSEETGTPDTIYYPYYNKGSSPMAYKIRKLPKSWGMTYPSIQGLFGANTCKGTDRLVITEGEEDCLAVKHMLTISGPSRDTDVISLPNGAGLDKTTQKELSFFERYNMIYLCFDPDEAGEDAIEAFADWLAPVVDIKIVELDPSIGDASSYLQAGKAGAFRKAFSLAKVYEPEGIILGNDIDLDSLLEPLQAGYPVPFEGLQNKLHGIRKGEITTICAGSGIGKTTFVREIAKSLIEQGLSVANIALEDQLNVTAQGLIALDMDIPLSTFRFHPPTKSETQPSYDKLIANSSTYFFKHFGGLNSDSLINKLGYYARSKAVDFIILDHLSMVISASDGIVNERKEIDHLMTKLAKLVVETGVGLIQIVHLKRTAGDKSYAKGGEVELTDLRGSAALEQLSWSVVGMERDQQGDDRDFSRIRVLKNRTFGFTGLCDTLMFNPTTGRLTSVKEESPELETEELMEDRE